MPKISGQRCNSILCSFVGLSNPDNGTCRKTAASSLDWDKAVLADFCGFSLSLQADVRMLSLIGLLQITFQFVSTIVYFVAFPYNLVKSALEQ